MNPPFFIFSEVFKNNSSLELLRDCFQQFNNEVNFNAFKKIISSHFSIVLDQVENVRTVRGKRVLNAEKERVERASYREPVEKTVSESSDVSCFPDGAINEKETRVFGQNVFSSVEKEFQDELEENKEFTPMASSASSALELHSKDSARLASKALASQELEDFFCQGTKPWLRHLRQSCKKELSEQVFVEPLKRVFNAIDRRFRQYITWDDMMNYLIEESRANTTNTSGVLRTYAFSRKMENNKVESSWMINTLGSATKENEEANYSRSKKGVKGLKDTIVIPWKSFTPPHVVPEIYLIRFIHGLPGHTMFAVSTRFTPLALYQKSDLSHYRSFTAEELGNTIPSMVAYLPCPDIILCFSKDDSCIRGWTFLLSKNNSTTLHPFKVDGGVHKMKTCPKYHPYSIFLGTSSGTVIKIEVPTLRYSTEMRISQKYTGLHEMKNGGLVDFVVNETNIFTTGFDHRILSVCIQTGAVSVIGTTEVSLFVLDYSELFSLILGVSYKNELLCWDANAVVPVRGTAFTSQAERDHFYPIKHLICVKDLPHCLTVDSMGTVKLWDLVSLKCVDTTRITGSALQVSDLESIYGLKGKGNDGDSKALYPVIDCCYLDELHELASCTLNSFYLLQYNIREDLELCDIDQVNKVFYDVREKSFVMQGSTRVTIWDAEEGYRKAVFDRALTDLPFQKKDITAMCVDDVGSRIMIATNAKEIEVFDTKKLEAPFEIISIPHILTEMVYSNLHKSLIGVSSEGFLFVRNEELRLASTVVVKVSTFPLYSLSVSESNGFFACCDEKGYLFLHDLMKLEEPSLLCRVDRPILCCALLGGASVLASAHDAGDVCLWSCPPVAEPFLCLMTFNVFTRLISNETINSSPITRDGKNILPSLISPVESELDYTQRSSSSFHRKSFGLPTTFNELVKFDSRRKKHIEKRNLKLPSPVLSDIAELTTLAFDDENHRLYCGDSRGTIFIFSLCSFLQWFQIRKASCDVRTPYFIEHWSLGHTAGTPRFVNSVKPHSDKGIISAKWFSEYNVLITCGVDRKVMVLTSDGKECGLFSKGRLPKAQRKGQPNSSTGSSLSQLFGSEVPQYNMLSNTESRRGSYTEKEDGDGTFFCNHQLQFAHGSGESMVDGSMALGDETIMMMEGIDLDRTTTISFSAGRTLLKSSYLGETVQPLTSYNSLEVVREKSSPTKKKKVFLKEDAAQFLATVHTEKNNHISFEKLEAFSSVRTHDTLTELEERRPHSFAGLQVLPILFASEFSPTTEALNKSVVVRSASARKRSELHMSFTSCSLVPPSLPKRGKLQKAKKISTVKPKETVSNLEIISQKVPGSLTTKGSETLFLSADPPLQTSEKKPKMRQKGEEGGVVSKTLPNGTPHTRLSSRKGRDASSPALGFLRPPTRDCAPLSNPYESSFIKEYRVELGRCVSGESGKHRRNLRQNETLAFSAISDRLKKVDRNFS